MRDWMIGIIVLLILGIVLDGFRRWRIARRESIRLSRNVERADKELSDDREGSSEFPSGGARIAKQRAPEDAVNVNSSLRETYESSRVTAGARTRIPEQVTLNLDEAVPMLMDSVEMPEDDHIEPTIGDADDIDQEFDGVVPPEPEIQVSEPAPPVEVTAEKKPEKKKSPKKRSKKEEPPAEEVFIEPDEVLIFNVMAHKGQRFHGEALLNALMKLEMKLGDMDIFHRHAQENGRGPVLFSLANMVVPGTFNLAGMSEFETPGVSLFLSLPLPASIEEMSESASLDAYNLMAYTARELCNDLDGELKDENRSVMTSQTIEHGRQRVIEYQRKRKLAKA